MHASQVVIFLTIQGLPVIVTEVDVIASDMTVTSHTRLKSLSEADTEGDHCFCSPNESPGRSEMSKDDSRYAVTILDH